MFRIIVVLSLLCTSFIAGARLVQAAYEWCSVDPLLAFTHESLLSSGVADVQVQVPRSALPLEGVAELSVRVPSNVQGREVLNMSVPLLFTLQTSFAPLKPAVRTSPYEVDFALLVPDGEHAFPVRLLVTNLTTGEITITEGVAGKTVRQSIAIVE